MSSNVAACAVDIVQDGNVLLFVCDTSGTRMMVKKKHTKHTNLIVSPLYAHHEACITTARYRRSCNARCTC